MGGTQFLTSEIANLPTALQRRLQALAEPFVVHDLQKLRAQGGHAGQCPEDHPLIEAAPTGDRLVDVAGSVVDALSALHGCDQSRYLPTVVVGHRQVVHGPGERRLDTGSSRCAHPLVHTGGQRLGQIPATDKRGDHRLGLTVQGGEIRPDTDLIVGPLQRADMLNGSKILSQREPGLLSLHGLPLRRPVGCVGGPALQARIQLRPPRLGGNRLVGAPLVQRLKRRPAGVGELLLQPAGLARAAAISRSRVLSGPPGARPPQRRPSEWRQPPGPTSESDLVAGLGNRGVGHRDRL